MIYFNGYPKIEYSFPDGNKLETTYIFARPDITITNVDSYNVDGLQYTVEDGKSPDNMSNEIYGDKNLFWVLLLQNNIIDFYNDWPIMYSEWLKELSAVNANYSFFTRFKMDIQKNDIVVKYRSDKTGLFEEDNYGVVIENDSFFRRFDVKMIKGDLNVGDPYLILRKNGNSYKIIQTPTSESYQILIKKTNKLDSVFSFEKIDENTGNKIPISPYYSITNQSLLSDQTVDILSISDCVLSLYMNSKLNLYPEISETTFKNEKEKMFLFTRKIKAIPSLYLNTVNKNYLKSISRESVNINV